MRSVTVKRMCVPVMAAIVLAAFAGLAHAAQVSLDVGLGQPTLLSGQKQTTYLKVALTGFEWKRPTDRPSVNIAVVIDKSGSMSGAKIQKAKEAAVMAVDRLASKDIVAIVAYDHNIRVLVPATKVSDKDAIRKGIGDLKAGGTTALFGGVSKGAAELRKFLDKKRVNRVILISDGLANVGPSSPKQLGELGGALIKEGISVTTVGLGLGYNEDLMMQLAQRSDGNHYFAENATELASIFKGELGDVLSVCAQEVTITIQCVEGIRPVRVIGRDADITGQNVTTILNQLYSGQEKYVLLEVEVPATPEDQVRPIANVAVTYSNMATKTADKLTSSVSARFTKSKELVAKSENRKVMIAAVEQIAVETNDKATALRDAGKIEEAKKLLIANGSYLKANGEKYQSGDLLKQGTLNLRNAETLDKAEWKRTRKIMRDYQSSTESQRKSR